MVHNNGLRTKNSDESDLITFPHFGQHTGAFGRKPPSIAMNSCPRGDDEDHQGDERRVRGDFEEGLQEESPEREGVESTDASFSRITIISTPFLLP